ncbi:NAD(P)/FAD-dependent oxidoreductase [Aurantiacibacter sp. MUD11]|uniref:flavin-containing monooxygenase n=1 Tax=Aurantiacibacter sp. MUD11 TaxID=3003265 RepID=UPI0022AB1826|nr:NAD(P)/FAD-dependent oxidoreductase [Aurantiacibacter sp. MUD11]WAT19224.1 NAD(P)/FAD-dependent oxidoreductase [Aurantiacibacter sp. MUD11]
MTGPTRLDALVVGAGFSGLYMLHKLRQEGFSAQVVEKGSGVGGTWFWNRYPGARCDIPSLEYSYGFDPQLEQEWEWTERYAAQGEILRYLEHVADRYDLRGDILLNTLVTSARWDEASSRWSVQTDGGDSFDVQFLILATGALSEPKMPDLPGLENFEGEVLFTAKWDDSVDLKGKNVCHFGTGSSGIQAVAAMSEYVGHLTVFQRTPSYAVPANNRPLEPGEQEAMKAHYQEMRQAARNSPLGFANPPRPGKAKEFAPDAREQRLEEAWNAGTTGLLNAFEDLLFDEESNEYAAAFAREKIAETVQDPDKVRKLTPSYPLGSRRMCAEIGFYDALNKDHVDLVDVREEPVVEITASEVVTNKGRYPADAITLATGFDACVGAIKAIDITGRDGREIAKEWDMGPRAYLGLAIEGFPNMFTVTGPGSPSVLSNVVVSIEQHVEWIARCMGDMRERGQQVIEATREAEAAWMQHADEVAQQTLFPRADSWYQGRTADGRQVFMPFVGGVGAYRAKCDEVAAQGYEGFALSP